MSQHLKLTSGKKWLCYIKGKLVVNDYLDEFRGATFPW